MKWKRWLLMIVLLVFILIEMRPPSIVYSSVFTTSEETEIHLYVQMNTFVKVDRDVEAEEIVKEHRKVNQLEGKVRYTLHLYRSALHYNWNCEYDTIICNEKGAIICCETEGDGVFLEKHRPLYRLLI